MRHQLKWSQSYLTFSKSITLPEEKKPKYHFLVRFPVFIIFKFLKIYFWKRESTSRGGTEKEGGRRSEVGSVLRAVSPMRGSNSQTARSRPEPKSGTRPTEPPGRPSTFIIFHCPVEISQCLQTSLRSIPPRHEKREVICPRSHTSLAHQKLRLYFMNPVTHKKSLHRGNPNLGTGDIATVITATVSVQYQAVDWPAGVPLL